MKKLLFLPLTLILLACTPLEQSARNTAAAMQGALTAAQTQYQTSCTAAPTQSVCTMIDQAVAAQNALITATEAYCGYKGTPAPVLGQPAGPPCTPVNTAAAALQAAIANARLFITELKGAIK